MTKKISKDAKGTHGTTPTGLKQTQIENKQMGAIFSEHAYCKSRLLTSYTYIYTHTSLLTNTEQGEGASVDVGEQTEVSEWLGERESAEMSPSAG